MPDIKKLEVRPKHKPFTGVTVPVRNQTPPVTDAGKIVIIYSGPGIKSLFSILFQTTPITVQKPSES